MAEFFITLRDTDKFESIHLSQAAADGEAALDTGLTAHVGLIDVPDGAVRGWPLANGALTNPESVPLTELEELKSAAQATHDQLLAWSAGLASIAVYYSAADVAKGHDWLNWGHHGVNRVVRSDHWTHAQKLAFLQNMAIGAADVTSPVTFFEGAHENDAPTEAVVWVNPDNAVRWDVADTIDNTQDIIGYMAAIPTQEELINGGWIDDLT